MIYKELPWSQVNIKDLLNQIQLVIEKENIFNDGKINISQDMKQLILRMLTIDFQKRMDWNELFNHKFFRDQIEGEETKVRDRMITREEVSLQQI